MKQQSRFANRKWHSESEDKSQNVQKETSSSKKVSRLARFLNKSEGEGMSQPTTEAKKESSGCKPANRFANRDWFAEDKNKK